MKTNRARNKLKKNGYMSQDPVPSSTSVIRGREVWLDKECEGTPISFFTQEADVDGAFKIRGRHPDHLQSDYWASTFTRNLSEAIRLSRA